MSIEIQMTEGAAYLRFSKIVVTKRFVQIVTTFTS